MRRGLIDNLSRSIESKGDGLKLSLSDLDHINFVTEYNGGYFFNHSLHIYGKSNLIYHSIDQINNLLNTAYLNIFDGLIAFAEDVFGNPFCFSNQGVVHFNIESGSKEVVAKDFSGWLNAIYNDIDYLTGKKNPLKWITN